MAFVPVYILILFFLILVDFTLAQRIDRSRGKAKHFYLLLSIISTLSILIVFKYFNFFNANLSTLSSFLGWHYSLNGLSLLLPLGLSFHTFQSLAYVIEVYRGRYPAEKNLVTYALYVMYFPQLVAGPIERPAQLLPQLAAVQSFNWVKCLNGFKRMGLGFFKKIVVADNLALYINAVYAHPHSESGIALVAATLFFAVQIYYDFSGYSDIAIGAAQTLGITLIENFKTPYFTASLREFWTRWHISLSSWFRDYMYIPLGGNRGSSIQWARNILIVFFLSGLWHGANWTYMVWGLIHGSFLILERGVERISHFFSGTEAKLNRLLGYVMRVSALIVILFAWIFFRANTLSDAWYITVHAVPQSVSELVALMKVPTPMIFMNALWNHLFLPITVLNFDRKQELLIVGGIAVFAIIEWLEFRYGVLNFLARRNVAVQWVVWFCLILALANLGATNEIPFIYFQF